MNASLWPDTRGQDLHLYNHSPSLAPLGHGGVVWHVFCAILVPRLGRFLLEATAQAPAIGLQPGLAKLVAIEVVHEKIGRRVDADQEMRESHDHDHGRVHLALTIGITLLTPDQLVEVGNDFDALTYDEEGGHGCKEEEGA